MGMRRKQRFMRHSFNRKPAPDRLLSLAVAVLLACMAMPSVVKLSHAIHEHKALRCCEEARMHFHAADFDCVFHKFKLSPPFYPPLFAYESYVSNGYPVFYNTNYTFLNRYQLLPFGLRAPPFYS